MALLYGAVPQPLFEDVTTRVRVDFQHENSPTSNKYLLETMGGGVGLIDYNKDGRLDIFLTNGARLADPMPRGAAPDKSDARYRNRLYRANPDGTYTDVTSEAGLTATAGYGMGIAVGDYDNDGNDDLYLTNYGANVLYHNNGDGKFEDVTARAGVAASGWSTSAGFVDYDNDGRLDLFVARYLDWDFSKSRYCGEHKPGYRAYCHPDNFGGVTSILFHNDGDGKFSDVSKKAGIANPEGKALGVAFADFDNDGWQDIYVANDSVQCFLYRNNQDGTFTDVSLAAGVGYDEDGRPFAGMGVDFSDYDNDGYPDIIVTNLSLQRYAVYRNNRDATFTYTTVESGVGRATLEYSGWGVKFIDYDNDGWKDVFAAQGHVMDTIHLTSPNLKYSQPPLLLRNERGRFRDTGAATGGIFARPLASRGAAFGDLDNDGDLDVVISVCGGRAVVLSNAMKGGGNWIRLNLIGTRSNRNGIGSRVTARVADSAMQVYEVHSGSSYLAASDRRVLIGLGDTHKEAKLIEIRWPGGAKQTLEKVKGGQTVEVREP
jgi:hypothetical protein